MDERNQTGSGQSEILKTKCTLLQKMLDVSSKQPTLIEGEDMEGLNGCIAERDRLAGEIDKLNTAFQAQPAQSSAGMIRMEEEVHNLLLAIQKQDGANIRLAQTKLKEYSGKIAQIKQARKGIQGYTMNIGAEDGSFIDKKK